MKKIIVVMTVTAVCAWGFILPSFASASVFSDFSVFGDDKLDTGTNVNIYSGMAGSNANVNNLGGGSNVQSVMAGGTFDSGTGILVTGNIISNGDLHVGGSGQVTGNVDSGGKITSGTNIVVNGNATAASSIALGGGSTVGGTTTAYGTPVSFTTVALPAQSTFSAGSTNISTSGSQVTNLTPGSYGNVTFGTSNVVNLAAGDYYFNKLSFGGNTIINVDLTGGDVRLFLVDDLTFNTNVDMFLTGGSASNIYLEAYNNINIGGNSDVFGTFYSGNNLDTGTNITITGALYSGHFLQLGGGSDVNFQLANHLGGGPGGTVPEPASMVLLGLGLLGVGVRKYRKFARSYVGRRTKDIESCYL